MRRRAKVWWALAGAALVCLLGLGAAVYEVHYRSQGAVVLHGDDPAS